MNKFAEDCLLELKKTVITPGGRVGDDRSTGSRSNRENWVERTARGKLPRYIRIVRNGLMKDGMSEGKATAFAVAAIKRWARGGDNVSPKVQAAAAAALAEWEAMKRQKQMPRPQTKRKFTAEQRRKAHTLPDGSFPIENEEDLRNAIQAIGRAKDPAKAKRHIITQARRLGKMDLIPDNWNTKDADMKIEYKTVGVSGLKSIDPDQGIVEAFVSVTGIVDNVKDIIQPGAYAKSLAQRLPKGVWSHDWNNPVSKALEAKELMPGDPGLPDNLPNGDPWPAEAGALWIKAQFNLDTERGRDAYADVMFFDDQQEWSIGYHVPNGGAKIDRKMGQRSIETMDVYEYSPVLWGAMPAARSGSVKEAQQTHMAFKSLLGDDYYLRIDADEMDNFLTECKSLLSGHEYSTEDEDLDLFEAEEVETGDKGLLSANSVTLLQKAIGALTDLLDAVVTDSGPTESKPTTAYDGKSLCEVVDEFKDHLGDGYTDLYTKAEDFDTAVDEGDDAAIEDTATAVLDVIDDTIDDAEDGAAESLKSVAAALGEILTKGSKKDEDEYEDDTEDETPPGDEEEEEEEEEEPTKKKTVDITDLELKGLRDFVTTAKT